MTNGEKIKAILKPRTDQIRIYGDWVEIEIQSLAINFSCELSWWNTKYEEPTTKQPKRGKWVYSGDMDYLDINGVAHNHFMCSKCGFIHDFIDGHVAQYNYCPSCGADMREVEET